MRNINKKIGLIRRLYPIAPIVTLGNGSINFLFYGKLGVILLIVIQYKTKIHTSKNISIGGTQKCCENRNEAKKIKNYML